MTRDDIIRMAREAGLLPHPENIVYQDPMFEGRIKTFAALVAAAEREVCAHKANIALLGADRGLANRVNQAIRNRT